MIAPLRLPLALAVCATMILSASASGKEHPHQIAVMAAVDGFDTASALQGRPSEPSNEGLVELPKITMKNGVGGRLEAIRELKVPLAWDSEGTPTAFTDDELGLRLRVFAQVHDEGKKINYWGEIRLAVAPDLEDAERGPSESPTVVTSVKRFAGTTPSGEQVSIPVVLPHGKPGALLLTLQEINPDGTPLTQKDPGEGSD